MNIMEDQVEKFVGDITRLHDVLSRTTDLRPSESINSLFGELVGMCTRTLNRSATEKIIQDPRIQKLTPSLRKICAVAESHLEAYWASYIAGDANTQDEIAASRRLKEFPYFQNYIDLTRMELGALLSANPSPPKKIAFIGSGPLPLSSLCLSQSLNAMAKSSNAAILNIDNSPEAISNSEALSKSLGGSSRNMKFLCKDAGTRHLSLSGFDVVYLAALVGMTQVEKEDLLVSVVGRMDVGALVVIRTAHGLRGLLYPDFDATTEMVLRYLEICLVVHPYDHVVNSVIVGRVRSRTRSGSRL